MTAIGRGTRAAAVARVLFATEPRRHDESLIGLVRRCASANHLPSVDPILSQACPAAHAFDNLAARSDLDPHALAACMRVPPQEIAARLHPSRGPEGARTIDFFGARIPAFDLKLSVRTIAPGAASPSSCHQALWQHVLVPFDRATGEILVDRCPICRRRLGWAGSGALGLCNMCGHDASGAPSERLPKSDLDATSPLAGLIDPDPSARDGDTLHPDLASLDRGAAFELGWRLGRATTEPAPTSRGKDGALPMAQRIAGLKAGSAMIAEWPDGLTDAVGRRLRAGDPTGPRLLAAVRRLAGLREAWPELAELLSRSHPDLLAPNRTVAARFVEGCMRGAATHRFLRVRAKAFRTMHRQNVIPTYASGGTQKIHAFFSADELGALKDALSDSLAIGAASERLGISLHGAEQLIAIDLLAEVDFPGVACAHAGRRVSRSVLRRLIERLSRLPTLTAADPDATAWIPLRRALVHIGGREKPWGPILRDVLSGTLEARRPEGASRASLILVRAKAITEIVAATFDRSDHPDRLFSATMPARDATGLLNINARGLQQALAAEAAPCRRDGRLDVDATVALAAERIGGAEISARFLGGSMRLPKFLRDGTLLRLGICGWDRASVERALG